MAGQVYSTHEHSLEKRGPRVYKVKSFVNRDILTCHLEPQDFAKIPEFPGPREIAKFEKLKPRQRTPKQAALLANMKRWYIGRQDDKDLPFLLRADTDNLEDAGPQGQKVFVGEGGKRPEVTVDHVCMYTSTCYIDFLLC
jgi:hypothetical protein